MSQPDSSLWQIHLVLRQILQLVCVFSFKMKRRGRGRGREKRGRKKKLIAVIQLGKQFLNFSGQRGCSVYLYTFLVVEADVRAEQYVTWLFLFLFIIIPSEGVKH